MPIMWNDELIHEFKNEMIFDDVTMPINDEGEGMGCYCWRIRSFSCHCRIRSSAGRDSNVEARNYKMSKFAGKFQLVSSDDAFDDFLKACGVNMIMRKAGSFAKPLVEICSEDGESFSLKTTTTFKTTELKFKLGEEFDETRMDGSNCKTVVTLEDGKLVQKQSGDKEVTIIREVEGDTMKTICKVEDIVSTRVYNRCE
ncbi:hypothetical protein JTE90_003696 [Oedothorax gibbosus]|uniref:Fatty acid-binding protein n=1 Tax=Oedothorax gibbosus TaxID=931172 RepID=A0AAV6VRG4_9ARAC|nr:hypothetical protein JTE90_003696 [Oedothorax gibbosus]